MAIKYYSLSELKALGLKNGQRLDSAYLDDDVGDAYNFACGECGFDNPLSTDTDYAKKQTWLLNIMQLWFLKSTYYTASQDVDIGDKKLGQAARELGDRIDAEEKKFAAAREHPSTAALFISATDLFGNLVVSGLMQDDVFGKDYREQ